MPSQKWSRTSCTSSPRATKKQKTPDHIRSMSTQRSKAQHPSSMPSDEIRRLQLEMAWLTAHIARLTAQQMTPALRSPMWPTQPSAHVQNTGDCPSGAHLQMFSFHRYCTHNEASCRAQCPKSACPSNATTTNTGCCFFVK
uniref:Uncharacterized protein n=1 Tax=Romanomermis culicivorax TaxID=13658 RepID=A0A915KZ62_ROMCU